MQSPVRQTPVKSPCRGSAALQALAIRHESVEKAQDSILGESPSPSKQVQRADWNLESPDKQFSLKLGLVEIQKVPEVYEEGESKSEEMSSHDLTAEEIEKDGKLGVFMETDKEKILDSQRDRQSELERLRTMERPAVVMSGPNSPVQEVDENNCEEI